jgi:transcriptional regulator with XRE-family HTH domain
MFSVVQQRTFPSPSNATEEAVYTALVGLRSGATEWDLLLDSDDPDPVDIRQIGSDVRARVRQVSRSASRLGRTSPFRYDPVAEALYLALAVLEAARRHGSLALESLDIEEDVADLQDLAARLSLARALARVRANEDLTVREIAGRVGISAGYWSDLEGAKAGLPSDDVLRRVESVTGENLRHLIERAEAAAHTLRMNGRERRARGARRREPEHRLDTVMRKLAGEDDLLDLVDRLLMLKPETRRALSVLINEASR